MKATDLMIGDWVLCDGKPYQIAEIGGMVCLDAEEELFASFEDIEPILLTPEILEKNEFEKLGYDGWEYKLKKDNKLMYSVLWRCDYPNALRISSYSFVYGDFNSFHIDNVHELQHALKLCRINLEIKL